MGGPNEKAIPAEKDTNITHSKIGNFSLHKLSFSRRGSCVTLIKRKKVAQENTNKCRTDGHTE